jgi:hypothetical protein
LKPLSVRRMVTIVRLPGIPLAMIEFNDPVKDLSRAQ